MTTRLRYLGTKTIRGNRSSATRRKVLHPHNDRLQTMRPPLAPTLHRTRSISFRAICRAVQTKGSIEVWAVRPLTGRSQSPPATQVSFRTSKESFLTPQKQICKICTFHLSMLCTERVSTTHSYGAPRMVICKAGTTSAHRKTLPRLNALLGPRPQDPDPLIRMKAWELCDPVQGLYR